MTKRGIRKNAPVSLSSAARSSGVVKHFVVENREDEPLARFRVFVDVINDAPLGVVVLGESPRAHSERKCDHQKPHSDSFFFPIVPVILATASRLRKRSRCPRQKTPIDLLMGHRST